MHIRAQWEVKIKLIEFLTVFACRLARNKGRPTTTLWHDAFFWQLLCCRHDFFAIIKKWTLLRFYHHEA